MGLFSLPSLLTIKHKISKPETTIYIPNDWEVYFLLSIYEPKSASKIQEEMLANLKEKDNSINYHVQYGTIYGIATNLVLIGYAKLKEKKKNEFFKEAEFFKINKSGSREELTDRLHGLVPIRT